MSLNIMIGSEAEDYVNIRNTIHFLDALSELKGVGVLDEERSKVLSNLIEWYKTMYDVLTNPELGKPQMFDPSELVDPVDLLG